MSMLFLRFFWLPSHYIPISYQPFIPTNQPTNQVARDELSSLCVMLSYAAITCQPTYQGTFQPTKSSGNIEGRGKKLPDPVLPAGRCAFWGLLRISATGRVLQFKKGTASLKPSAGCCASSARSIREFLPVA